MILVKPTEVELIKKLGEYPDLISYGCQRPGGTPCSLLFAGDGKFVPFLL
jgi:hypothetical protein